MPIFPHIGRLFAKRISPSLKSRPTPDIAGREIPAVDRVRRHFYNERGFQTYGTFFAHWGGWITAGHVISEAALKTPPFADGDLEHRPGGLDAALLGCDVPSNAPPNPYETQEIVACGYPAGSQVAAVRFGKVYMKRPNGLGPWIAHIEKPDEPVVVGMSGGAVFDIKTREPIGIIITRNSPADLNHDRDPDESFDFVPLSEVWSAIMGPPSA